MAIYSGGVFEGAAMEKNKSKNSNSAEPENDKPKHWVYHPKHPAQIVETDEYYKLLEGGWYDTPAKFPGHKEQEPQESLENLEEFEQLTTQSASCLDKSQVEINQTHKNVLNTHKILSINQALCCLLGINCSPRDLSHIDNPMWSELCSIKELFCESIFLKEVSLVPTDKIPIHNLDTGDEEERISYPADFEALKPALIKKLVNTDFFVEVKIFLKWAKDNGYNNVSVLDNIKVLSNEAVWLSEASASNRHLWWNKLCVEIYQKNPNLKKREVAFEIYLRCQEIIKNESEQIKEKGRRAVNPTQTNIEYVITESWNSSKIGT